MKLLHINKLQLAVLSVMLIVAIDMFGITFVIPVFATFSKELGAPMRLLGVLYSVYSGAAFLSSLVFGVISDWLGRRNTFLMAGVGAFAAFVGSGCAQTFPELIVWRGIAGLFTGTIGCAYAYISDVTPPADRPRYFSYVSALMSTCFVVGPLIGGGFAVFGIRVPFYAAAVCAGLGLLTTFFFVHEPKTILDEIEKDKVSSSAYTALPQSDAESAKNGGVETAKTGAIELVEKEKKTGEEEEDKNKNKAEPSKASAAGGKPVEEGVSPWLNPKAMIVGGLGTFFNGITYTGIAVLVPLLLMNPSFGIVAEKNGRRLEGGGGGGVDAGAAMTPEESRKLSLTIGYILGLFGLVQAIGMIFLFPRVNKLVGLISTASIGGAIFGVSFLCLVVCDTIGKLIPIYIAMAIGNALSRPAFPAFLGLIAPKGRNASYVSINSSFSNMAMMIGAQLTLLYIPYPKGAFFLAGFITIFNSVMLFCFDMYLKCTVAKEEVPIKEKTDLEKFFGEGKSEQLFWDDLHKDVAAHLRTNNYAKALQTSKGQQAIKELMLKGLPHLPETSFDDRMEAVYNIYLSLGHEDWANELAGYVPALHKHLHSELGVPGAT